MEPEDPHFWFQFMKKVAYREGAFGEIFAEDLMRAVDQLDLPPIVKKAAKFQFPLPAISSGDPVLEDRLKA